MNKTYGPMIFLAGLWASQTMAYQCALTVTKDVCWKDYQITVYLKTYANKKNKPKKLFTIGKNKMKVKKKFACHPKQKVAFSVSVSPAIWTGSDKDRYKSKSVWLTPENIEDDATWELSLCLSKDFKAVPMPLVEKPQNCHCPAKSN